MKKGQHKVVWDGTNDNGKSVASGIYFSRLSYENEIDFKKMVLMK